MTLLAVSYLCASTVLLQNPGEGSWPELLVERVHSTDQEVRIVFSKAVHNNLDRAVVNWVSGRRVVVFVPAVRANTNQSQDNEVLSMGYRNGRKGVAIVLRAKGQARFGAQEGEQTVERGVLRVRIRGLESAIRPQIENPKNEAQADLFLDTKQKKDGLRAAAATTSKKISGSRPAEMDVSGSAWSAPIILFGVLLVFLGALLWWLRRRKDSYPNAESIDVVAVKNLGGRHRLALIEACGDRLLIASSDKDVQLLGKVGASGGLPSFAEALREESAGNEELGPLKEMGDPSVPDLKLLSASSDLAGLKRLRAQGDASTVRALERSVPKKQSHDFDEERLAA